MRPLIAPLLAASLLAAAPAPATTVRVEVDRNEVSLQDQISMSVVVEGAPGGVRPELPPLPDFEVYPQGTMQSTHIVNGRVSQSLIFRYTLVPTREGRFEVGAVRIDGTDAASAPFTLRVTSAPRDRSVFVAATVSETKPWVGQQVIYTFRLYRRVLIDNARLEPIDIPNATYERLDSGQEFQTTIDGQAYAVSEVKLAIFPNRPGTLEIPAISLSCDVLAQAPRRGGLDDFFRPPAERRPRVLRTDPIRLEVRALPAPPTGWSGLVGDFELVSKASRTTLTVGESTTLELTVSGSGNALAIPEPRLGDLAAFKVYDEQPSSSIQKANAGVSGTKTYRKALVPTQAGVVTIPEATLVIFDPKAAQFRTISSPAIPLEVSAREGQEDVAATVAMGPTAGKVEVRILGDDILPSSRDLEAVRAPSSELPFWLGLALPPLLWSAAAWWSAHRRRLASDQSLRRRREASRTLSRALAELPVPAREAALAASRALRAFIGDMLGFEGAAATSPEIADRLAGAEVGAELVAEVRAMLDRFDAAGYGGAPVAGAPDVVADLAKRLAAVLGRGGRG